MNLYIYPHAKKPIHDLDVDYANTVPFCQEGIKRHCKITDPDNADIFYMGQFSDDCPNDFLSQEMWSFWESCPEKHACDIEGDWPFREPPMWLMASPISINGCDLKFSENRWFVRPTFSKLLISLVKNEIKYADTKKHKRLAFMGLPDQHGCRLKMQRAISVLGYPNDIVFTQTWNGPTNPNSQASKIYQEHLRQNIFSLCPRGNGKDSARFFEACCFGNIPIIVGDNKIPFENECDTFFFRISEFADIHQWKKTLDNIFGLSDNELHQLQEQSKDYFTNKIRPYILDPTGTYINWLLNK